jgi:hypothetical protein
VAFWLSAQKDDAVALALECEATFQLAEHRLAAGLDFDQVGIFIDAVLAMVEPVETHFM